MFTRLLAEQDEKEKEGRFQHPWVTSFHNLLRERKRHDNITKLLYREPESLSDNIAMMCLWVWLRIVKLHRIREFDSELCQVIVDHSEARQLDFCTLEWDSQFRLAGELQTREAYQSVYVALYGLPDFPVSRIRDLVALDDLPTSSFHLRASALCIADSHLPKSVRTWSFCRLHLFTRHNAYLARREGKTGDELQAAQRCLVCGQKDTLYHHVYDCPVNRTIVAKFMRLFGWSAETLRDRRGFQDGLPNLFTTLWWIEAADDTGPMWPDLPDGFPVVLFRQLLAIVFAVLMDSKQSKIATGLCDHDNDNDDLSGYVEVCIDIVWLRCLHGIADFHRRQVDRLRRTKGVDRSQFIIDENPCPAGTLGTQWSFLESANPEAATLRNIIGKR
jgi:hypothetical protein